MESLDFYFFFFLKLFENQLIKQAFVIYFLATYRQKNL